jgi:hypothetical protein
MKTIISRLRYCENIRIDRLRHCKVLKIDKLRYYRRYKRWLVEYIKV